ncbi:MAG: hypothetical protein WCF84_17770 [Anaerolineae bacterium]
MKPDRIPGLYRRVLMLAVMCGLILYSLQLILPGNAEKLFPDLAFNSVAQIGLYIILSLAGALIGFWITFGDLFRQQEK